MHTLGATCLAFCLSCMCARACCPLAPALGPKVASCRDNTFVDVDLLMLRTSYLACVFHLSLASVLCVPVSDLQAQNLERAFAILRSKLFEAELQRQQEEIYNARKSQVSTATVICMCVSGSYPLSPRRHSAGEYSVDLSQCPDLDVRSFLCVCFVVCCARRLAQEIAVRRLRRITTRTVE